MAQNEVEESNAIQSPEVDSLSTSADVLSMDLTMPPLNLSDDDSEDEICEFFFYFQYAFLFF